MAYVEMRLICGDCMEPFAFTSDEQGARALHGSDGRQCDARHATARGSGCGRHGR